MDPAAFQQAYANALAAAGRLRLPLRSRSWRGQAGEFTGSGTGSSLDFQDHRSYMPGDDPRHINWQAYARTGTYTMKLYREEVRPVIDLIADVSESMFFEPSKALRSAELICFICESCASAGAAVNVTLVRGNAAAPLDPALVRGPLWWDSVRKLAPADPAAPPDLAKIPLRANAIRVFLSDLLFPADPEPMLRHLSQRHGDVILLSPWLAAEADPDWDGNCDFIDPERGVREAHRIEPATLRRYRDAYQNHFALWKNAARRHHAAFARIPCAGNLATVLAREAVPAGALEAVGG